MNFSRHITVILNSDSRVGLIKHITTHPDKEEKKSYSKNDRFTQGLMGESVGCNRSAVDGTSHLDVS